MKIILNESLNDLQPIHWSGEGVHARYHQIVSFLESRNRHDLAAALAKPVLPEDDGNEPDERDRLRWLSDQVRSPVPLTQLDASHRAEIEPRVRVWVDEITALASELSSDPDPEVATFGELLPLAVELPDLDHILVEGDRFVVAGWGFKSQNPRQQEFRLTSVLPPAPAPPDPDPPPGERDDALRPEPHEPEEDEPIEDPEEPEDDGSGPSWKWWLLILGVVAILLFLLLLSQCLSGPSLPDVHGLVVPPDAVEAREDEMGRQVVAGWLIVTLAEDAEPRAFMKAVAEDRPGNGLAFEGYSDPLSLVQVSFDPGAEAEVREALSSRDDVIALSAEVLVAPADQGPDPALESPVEGEEGHASGWGLQAVGAPEAWETSRGSRTATVALLDSGFDPGHPELKKRVRSTFHVPGRSRDLPAEDAANGHGTHTAGVAVGNLGNAAGSSGVCPGCRTLLIDVATAAGRVPLSSLIKGLIRAKSAGADVVGLPYASLAADAEGVPPGQTSEVLGPHQARLSQEERLSNRVFGALAADGIVVVKAAGNADGPASGDPLNRSSHVISVGAVDRQLERAAFSNHGETVRLSAPGVQIYSAEPGRNYGFRDGTSAATAFVAGAVGILRSIEPTLSPEEIGDLLIRTGNPVPADGDGRRVGPVIDLASAVGAVGSVTAICSCEDLRERIRRIERLVGAPKPEPQPGGTVGQKCPAQEPSEVILVFDTSGSMKYNYDLDPSVEQRVMELYEERDRLEEKGDFFSLIRAEMLGAKISRIEERLETAPGRDRIDVAKTALVTLLEAIPENVDVSLLTFGGGCGEVRRYGPFPASQRNKLAQIIGRQSPEGGTPLGESIRLLQRYAEQGKTPEAPSNVIIVSDGQDNCGGNPCRDASAVKKALPHAHVSVIAASRNLETLQCVSRSGGGMFVQPQNTDEFAKALRQAAGQEKIPGCP